VVKHLILTLYGRLDNPVRFPYNSGMNEEINQVFAWLGMTLDTYDIRLGEFEAAFNERDQIQTYHCLGCNAEHFSKWPDWKLNFVHKPECMYMKLQSLMDKALEP
jgi:hypothetical protein